MMRRNLVPGVLAVLALAVVFGISMMAVTSSAADDDHNGVVARSEGEFTNRSIEGTWGFVGGGTAVFFVTDDKTGEMVRTLVPVASNGIIKFDGKGECSATDFVKSPDGRRGPRESAMCNYFVGSDGIGWVENQFPDDPVPNKLIFVTVDHGRELQFIVDQPGAVVSFGSIKKQ
jgi:hypothetical protein